MKKSFFKSAPGLLLLFSLILIASAVARIFVTGGAVISGDTLEKIGDQAYVEHWVLSFLHLIPGLTFATLAPFQFSDSFRKKNPRFHRVSGRICVAAAFVVSVTGFIMNMLFPYTGGLAKMIEIYVAAIGMFSSTLIAVRAIAKRDFQSHRRWMIRAFAFGMTAATQRFLLLPLFLTSGMPGDLVFGTFMWLGLIINIGVAEFFIRRPSRSASSS